MARSPSGVPTFTPFSFHCGKMTLCCVYIYLHMRCTHIDLNNISSQLHKYAHVIVMIIAIHHNHNCHSILFCYHSYWHDYQSRIHGYHLTSTSVEASIKSAEKKTQGLLEHIYNGSTMHKYNYSPSRQHLDHSFSSKFNFSPFFFPSKNLQIFLFFLCFAYHSNPASPGLLRCRQLQTLPTLLLGAEG